MNKLVLCICVCLGFASCRHSGDPERESLLAFLSSEYVNSARYPCTVSPLLSTSATALTFRTTSAGTQMAFAVGGAQGGQNLILNSTTTSLNPAPVLPAATTGTGCTTASASSIPAALSTCSSTTTSMSCGVLLSNTYLFRFEFSLASAPTDITAKIQ